MFDVTEPLGSTGLTDLSIVELEDRVQYCAAQLAADTARWLLMVAELDRREAFLLWECQTMAHWLSWKCGVSLHTGRQQVRVARALESLPLVQAGFLAGRLSFSKVRALTRLVMKPELEAELVEMAQTATAAQLDQIASAYLRTTRGDNPEHDANNHEARRFDCTSDDHGMTTLKITAPYNLVAIIMTAIDRVMNNTAQEAGLTIAQHRVDALLRIASSVLEPDESLPANATIIIHTEESEPRATQDVSAETPPARARVRGLPISRSAYERLRCNANVAIERTRLDGTVDRTPTTDAIPRTIRRAVMRRDCGRCRWPGCGNSYRVEVHHLVFWTHGGRHDIWNLACLCAVHHHAVHDRGWAVTGDANQVLTFTSPRGRTATEQAPEIQITPSRQRSHAKRQTARCVTATTIATATNEPIALEWAVGAICDNVHVRNQRKGALGNAASPTP